MAKSMSRLNVSLTANTGQFNRAMNGASKMVTRTARQITGIARKLTSPIALITGGLSGAAFIGGIRSAARRMDALAKSADKLGLTTQALAGFQHAAEQTGLAANSATTALQRMVRRVAEAAQGTGEARNALVEMGLSARDLARLTPDQQFARIADAMQGVASQGDRVRLAMRLFDTEGVALVNTLTLGSDGLERMQKEAESLGIAVSRVDAAKIEAANDAMDSAGKAVQGVFNTIAIKIGPVIEALAEKFTAAAADGTRMGDAVRDAFNGILSAVGFVADAIYALRLVWKGLVLGFARIGKVGAETFNDMAKGMQVIGQRITRMTDIFGAAGDVIGAVFDAPLAAVKMAFAGMIGFIASSINTVLDKIRGMAHKLGLDTVVEQSEVAMDAMNAMAKAADDMAEGSEGADKIADAMDRLDKIATADFAPAQGIKSLNEAIDKGTKGIWKLEEEIQAMKDAGMPSGRIAAFLQEIEQAADKAAAEVARVATPQESLDQSLAQLDTLLDAELLRIQEHNAKKEEVEALARQRRIDSVSAEMTSLNDIWRSGLEEREAFTKASTWAQTKDVLGSLEQMTRGVATENKAMFKINKVAGIANAIVNTSEGVTKTLAKYPGPLGIALAGVHAAAGFAQVQAIRSQRFGGDGASAPSTAGSSPNPAPTGGGIATETTASRPVQDIVIQGDSISVERLSDLSREAEERGFTIGRFRGG